MTPMPSSDSFTVDFIGTCLADLKAIAAEATRRGLGDRYRNALESIYRGLKTRARDCGEPMFDFRSAQLQVRVFSQTPLSVIYGVHHHKPHVFVRAVVNMQPFAAA
jgi:hypothetical protein